MKKYGVFLCKSNESVWKGLIFKYGSFCFYLVRTLLKFLWELAAIVIVVRAAPYTLCYNGAENTFQVPKWPKWSATSGSPAGDCGSFFKPQAIISLFLNVYYTIYNVHSLLLWAAFHCYINGLLWIRTYSFQVILWNHWIDWEYKFCYIKSCRMDLEYLATRHNGMERNCTNFAWLHQSLVTEGFVYI